MSDMNTSTLVPNGQKFEFLLHFIHSPHGISWRSPSALALSALANIISGETLFPGHSIGHVHVELKARDLKKRFFTSITIDNQNQYYDVLVKKRIGFGILFHRFKGRLESPEEIQASLNLAQRQRRLQTLRLAISAEAFARAEEYLTQLLQIKNSLQYGFPCEPRKREGAGCTAFAMSFLEVMGVSLPDFSQWQQTIHVPLDLIGEGFRKVSLLETVASPRAFSWGKPEESQTLRFWDPDLMFHWAKKRSENRNTVLIDAKDQKVSSDSIWLEN